MTWMPIVRTAPEYLYFWTRNRYFLNDIRKEKSNKVVRKNIYPYLGVLFVHIPKTAGTTMHEFFAELEDKSYNSGSLPDQNLLYLDRIRSNSSNLHKHAKAVDYLSAVGTQKWNVIRSVTVVRNPWDFAVSSYHWWLQKGTRFKRHLKDALKVRRMQDFDEFVRSDLFAETTAGHAGRMRDWFQKDGADVVSCVLRLEHLAEDLHGFLVNIHPEIAYSDLPCRNKTERRGYQSYYTNETIEIVRKQYQYIIERFSYSFNSEPISSI